MEKKLLETKFALCIENDGCEDIEKRKFYQILLMRKRQVKDIYGSLMNLMKIICIPKPISYLLNCLTKYRKRSALI